MVLLRNIGEMEKYERQRERAAMLYTWVVNVDEIF